MSDLKQKLAAAKVDYEAARAALEMARSKYENGPLKEYVGVMESIATLAAKIEEHETALAATSVTLGVALRASNGVTTDAVKKALLERRNSEEVIEECRVILQEFEKQKYAIRFEVSLAANYYRTAYTNATERWAMVNTYAVLVDCGERICEAMAVMPWQRIEATGDSHTQHLTEFSLAKNVIRAEVDELLTNYKGETKPYISELGVFDCGAFPASEIMSLAQMQMARAKLQPQ